MNKCEKCGTEFDGNFCSECGESTCNTKLCPKCRNDVSKEAKFCNYCGYSFIATEKHTEKLPRKKTDVGKTLRHTA